MLRYEIESNNRIKENKNLHIKYFIINSTPNYWMKAIIKSGEVNKAKRYYGYLALVKKENIDSLAVLEA